jgi:mannose-6-phosphate isomerase-like protein (cupin superfamily)
MEPVLLGPGEGEVITQKPEREVRIICEHPLLDATWARYSPGERGPEAHVHYQHADAFYVLDGELLFELGPDAQRVVAPAGTLVLIPQGVVHHFRNESRADASYLNIHAPSGGFAESLRGNTKGFDSHDPPENGGRPVEDAVVHGPGQGADEIAAGESRLLVKAGGNSGDGTVLFAESTLAPGFPGPPPHRHERHVDTFFVLDGTLTLRLADEEMELGPGSYGAVPPGHVHTFANRSDSRVRVINLMAPGGFEEFIKAVQCGEQPTGYDFQVAV